MDYLKVYWCCHMILLSAGEVPTSNAATKTVSTRSPLPMGNPSKMFDLNLPKRKGPGDEWFGVDLYPRMFSGRRRAEGFFKWKKPKKAGRSAKKRSCGAMSHGPMKPRSVGKNNAMKTFAIASIRIGRAAFLPPLRGIETTVNLLHDVGQLGSSLTKRVLAETKGIIKVGLEAVKCVSYPLEKISVLLFPTGLACVVDTTLNTTWYLTSMTEKKVSATKVWALFVSSKQIFKTLRITLKTLQMECIKLPTKKMDVYKGLIDKVEFDQSKVCGWPNFVAVNNVTIIKDFRIFLSHSLLEIRVPILLERVDIHFKEVNVTSLGTMVLIKAEMKVRIEKIFINTKITFLPGTVLRFLTIKLRVEKIVGFTIKFPNEDNKSYIEDMIEGMADLLGTHVIKAVNDQFTRNEDRISKLIKKG